MNSLDVVVGLQHGDEGKGKVAKCLSEKNEYDCFVRFNGGPNAGHTIYLDNKKLVLHQIPCGIFKNKPCLISSGCVIDYEKLKEEIKIVEKYVPNVNKLLHLAFNAHLILQKYIEDDINNNKVGTTCSGIGPTYSSKMLRIGKRVCDTLINLKIVDPFIFLQQFNNILMEGAQGFMLDIDYGDYPYVTSSSCIAGAIYQNGIPLHITPIVYGIAKLYDTYVGSKQFQPKKLIFKNLQKIGNEYGATTGRPRQCNWLSLDDLIKAIYVNSVNILIINKCDIIEKLNEFHLFYNNIKLNFRTIGEMKNFIDTTLQKETSVKDIIYSSSPHTI